MHSDGDGKAHVKVNGHPYLVSKEECINYVHNKSSKELHLVILLEVQSCDIFLTLFLYYFNYILSYIIFMYYYLLCLYANLLYLYILYYDIIYLINNNC